MFEILQYPFMQRALLAGVILSAALALLGVFVLLRRMTFFADGVAHASLAGIAIGVIFSFYPLGFALALAALFAVLIYFIERRGLASDTAIGILFTSGMALGVLLMSLRPGYQPELIGFLFGNILAIGAVDVAMIAAAALVIILFVARFFKQLTLLSLDQELAHVEGINIGLLQPVFYVMLALTVVLGIKMLGVILVSALLVLPTASARLLSSTLKGFVARSIVISELIALGGILLSVIFDWPTGPVIVLVGALIFIIVFALGTFKKSTRE